MRQPASLTTKADGSDTAGDRRDEPVAVVPTSHEYEVLEMLNGDRKGEWGAWVGACLEFLSGAGLCTRGPQYQITDAGKQALKARGEQQ